jgi:hypothetical protein
MGRSSNSGGSSITGGGGVYIKQANNKSVVDEEDLLKSITDNFYLIDDSVCTMILCFLYCSVQFASQQSTHLDALSPIPLLTSNIDLTETDELIVNVQLMKTSLFLKSYFIVKISFPHHINEFELKLKTILFSITLSFVLISFYYNNV